MRIRSTKPEFWRSAAVSTLDWEVVYDGPLPKRRVNKVAPAGSWSEYVYLLFDSTDELVYVGRSFRPADRFSKHCRKPWWGRVSGVVFIRVQEKPKPPRRFWEHGPNTAVFEAAAIQALRPSENIVGRAA